MNHTSLRRWGWMLLLTPYFKPAVFGVLNGTDWLEQIFDIWRLLAAVVICGLYAYGLFWKKKRPSAVLLWLGVYLGFIALAEAMGMIKVNDPRDAFRPRDAATRGEAAEMLWRFLNRP